jgi:hypothetical protein
MTMPGEALRPRILCYRWDDAMGGSILKTQLVPKTVWNEFFVGFGVPCWKTNEEIFYRVLRGIGVGSEVLDGRLEHL